MAKILVIDDEAGILELIKNGLQKDNHVISAYTSATQVSVNNLSYYDLIILDVMMPDIDGFSFCKKIRTTVDCPILFLTAKTLESDVLYGLGIGADDYLTKPFRIAELRGRVNAHLRREKREKNHSLNFGDVTLNLSAKEILIKGKSVPLTRSEFMICEFLAKNKGQFFSKEQIYEAVFSLNGESDNSTIPTHIMNIRNKFSDFNESPILTVWGIGYKWK